MTTEIEEEADALCGLVEALQVITNKCPHGGRKINCPECNGCEHFKLIANCKICKPCPHDTCN